MPPKRGVIKVKAYVRRTKNIPKPKKMPVPRKRAAPKTPTYDPNTGWRKKADGVFDCHNCGASQEFRKSDYGLNPHDGYY